jgi:hypothetical protein
MLLSAVHTGQVYRITCPALVPTISRCKDWDVILSNDLMFVLSGRTIPIGVREAGDSIKKVLLDARETSGREHNGIPAQGLRRQNRLWVYYY